MWGSSYGHNLMVFYTTIGPPANHFSWEPLKEVAKLFFGIFMTIIPVIAMLNAGHEGSMAL